MGFSALVQHRALSSLLAIRRLREFLGLGTRVRTALASGGSATMPAEERNFAEDGSLPAWHAPGTIASGSSWEEAVATSPEPAAQGVLLGHHLRKSYKARLVVEDVSMMVRRGEVVGLLGPNGAGKTTLFYMITGLIRPDGGLIKLDGHDVTRLPMYRRARLGIGYLPQEASVFRGLSVENNIRAVLEIVEPNKAKRAAELEALLEEFDIKSLRKTPSIALSGGGAAALRDRAGPGGAPILHAPRRAIRRN